MKFTNRNRFLFTAIEILSFIVVAILGFAIWHSRGACKASFVFPIVAFLCAGICYLLLTDRKKIGLFCYPVFILFLFLMLISEKFYNFFCNMF